MELKATVGPRRVSGSNNPMRIGADAEQVVTDAHGRYAESVQRNKTFFACNPTGKAITAVATSATTGFVLYNPPNSGFNLSLLEIFMQQTSTATTAVNTIQLSVCPTATVPTSLTALTVRSALLGSGTTGVGVAYSDATLGTANVAVRPLWTPSVSATATTGIPGVIKDEVAGAMSVAPGFFVCVNSTAAFSAITLMTWEEIAVY